MQRCTRCSYCKYIPWRYIKDFDYMEGCPSAARYHWHAYAAGGKYNLSYALTQGAIEIDDSFLDVVYKCMMDGSCDIACKVQQDIEPLQHMQELRIECVDQGYLLPQHQPYLRSLRNEDNMLLKPRAERGDWAADLDVKRVTQESAEVVYFAGCRYSYDQELWPIARAGVTLLQAGRSGCGHPGSRRSLLRRAGLRAGLRRRADQVRRAPRRHLQDGGRQDAGHALLGLLRHLQGPLRQDREESRGRGLPHHPVPGEAASRKAGCG